MTANIAFPGFYLQQLGILINDLGGDFIACLAEAGVTEEEIAQPIFHCELEQIERFIQTALKQTQTPELGMIFGERLLVHTHGALGYAAMNAATLNEAIITVESFLRIRIAFMRLEIEDGNKLLLKSDIALGELERFFFEVVCMALKIALDFICHKSSALEEIHFSFEAPKEAALVVDMFACPIKYQQPHTALIINTQQLNKPLRIAEPQAFALAQKMCAEALAELSGEDSLTDRIKRYMLVRHSDFPSQETICQHLHMTQRTLHRHLKKEGTSFRTITDQVKSRLAQQYLDKGQHTQQEVAYLLGYSDAANFRRALRRWQSQ